MIRTENKPIKHAWFTLLSKLKRGEIIYTYEFGEAPAKYFDDYGIFESIDEAITDGEDWFSDKAMDYIADYGEPMPEDIMEIHKWYYDGWDDPVLLRSWEIDAVHDHHEIERSDYEEHNTHWGL